MSAYGIRKPCLSARFQYAALLMLARGWKSLTWLTFRCTSIKPVSKRRETVFYVCLSSFKAALAADRLLK